MWVSRMRTTIARVGLERVALVLLAISAMGMLSPSFGVQAAEPGTAHSAGGVAPIPSAETWRTAVLTFAKAHERNPAWGFSHSERDYELGRSLAAADHVKLDDDVMFAAAYLHDIGAFQPYARRGVDHSDIGADIVGQLLSNTGFPTAKIPAVAAAIRTHMYYRSAVGAEAIYLHDADALDWLGAIGAARIFGLEDPQGGQPDGPAAVKRLQNLLMQVPPGLESKAGKAMLAPRVRELRRILAELSAETDAYRIL